MKKTTITLALTLLLAITAFAQRQQEQLPSGVVVYALPRTSIQLSVEAIHEVFTAGPYAQFAPKYLGIEAPTENKESFSLKSVDLRWAVEADPARTFTIAIKDSKAAESFLAMTSTGMVALFENSAATAVPWRFSNEARIQDFNYRGHESHLARESTTFFRNVQTARGFERVPVQQSQVVEKNTERRAEEAANAIFNLRKKRMELITGENDALSGEAMRAALEEINRMEQEYMSLFVGKSSFDTQSANFEVVPDPTQTRQMYIAFRLSDTQGLLAPDNMGGRPIVLELVSDRRPAPTNANDNKGRRVSYRIPEVVQARLLDGQNLLLQTRVPVYQLGRVMTFPL